MEILSHFLSLGLTDNEAKLLLTLFEIGSNPVSTVARRAAVSRTTAYAALETLKKKGLVSLVEKDGIQQYCAITPEKLEEYAFRQKEKAAEVHVSISGLVGTLQSLTGEFVMAPKVKYFEGLEGVKVIFEDTLEVLKQLPKKERLKLSFSSAPDIGGELRTYLDDYISRRKSLGVSARVMIPHGRWSSVYLLNAHENLSDVRLMPDDLPVAHEMEMDVYGNKVSMVSLKKDRYHGVIIESQEIAENMRVIHELAWRGCEPK